MKIITCLMFLTILLPDMCLGQKIKLNKVELRTVAEKFIRDLSYIIDSNKVAAFNPQLIVNKEELIIYLDYEFRKKYGKRRYKKIQKEFGHPINNAWPLVSKDDGYRFASPFVEKDPYSTAKIISPELVNARFSDVTISKSKKYDSHFGEISFYNLLIVKAKVLTNCNPIYEFNMSFPCILTLEKKLKLVAKTKSEFVSKTINYDLINCTNNGHN